MTGRGTRRRRRRRLLFVRSRGPDIRPVPYRLCCVRIGSPGQRLEQLEERQTSVPNAGGLGGPSLYAVRRLTDAATIHGVGHNGWRALIGAAGASALCWGVAGTVHLGLVHHNNGRRRGGWSLPDGGGFYEFAFVAGAIVTLYWVPGLLRRKEWWPALSLSLGTVVGAVSVLGLGQEPRHWVTAVVMVALGVTAPLVSLRWGRQRPGAVTA